MVQTACLLCRPPTNARLSSLHRGSNHGSTSSTLVHTACAAIVQFAEQESAQKTIQARVPGWFNGSDDYVRVALPSGRIFRWQPARASNSYNDSSLLCHRPPSVAHLTNVSVLWPSRSVYKVYDRQEVLPVHNPRRPLLRVLWVSYATYTNHA